MDTHTYKPVDKVQEHILMSSLNFLNISRIFFFLVVDTPGTGSITGYITQPFKQCQQLKNGFIKCTAALRGMSRQRKLPGKCRVC